MHRLRAQTMHSATTRGAPSLVTAAVVVYASIMRLLSLPTLRTVCAAVTAVSALAVSFAGCDSETDTQDSDVIVNTESEAQWAQYVRNVEFAEGYVPTCSAYGGSHPRVLVTGFGRFLENAENATGRMVSHLVPSLTYPLTEAPKAGEVDDPEAQTAVAQEVVDLAGFGEVEVCAIVLPVFWDLASIVALKEIEAFEPDMVLMNGIAGERQPIWLELGSVNEAVALPDGSGTLAPVESGSKLVSEAPDEDKARGLVLSWEEVRDATRDAIDGLADETDDSGVRFGDVVGGALFAGYPRSSNTYLCNNTTYVVNYVLDHPYDTFRLLEPSKPREGGPTGVDVTLGVDLGFLPRVFVHWPKEVSPNHLDRGRDVMATLIAAQLTAIGDPSRGSPSLADFTD